MNMLRQKIWSYPLRYPVSYLLMYKLDMLLKIWYGLASDLWEEQKKPIREDHANSRNEIK